MTKQRRNSREDKKKPAMTPKEKKVAKRARKNGSDIFNNDKIR
jgi:hypothetical protein